jgi:alkylated DNA repair protein (DNA oxidative demethylase)
MNLSLFRRDDPEHLAPGAMLLRGLVRARASQLLAAIDDIARAAPLRHLVTPGGHTMSVAMTNAGPYGWVSDRHGYRYAAADPLTGRPWPALPRVFLELAAEAAAAAGFPAHVPDCCLVNRYAPGARLTMHQDRDEDDHVSPIVSVSLGLPAIFVWGGFARGAPGRRVALEHGDVVVFGGPSRLRFHGVLPLAEGQHPLTGSQRLNLTFRKVH